MKKIITSVCVAIVAAFVILGTATGCKTVVVTDPNTGISVTNKVVNADAIKPIIAGTVPIAVQVAIAQDTNSVVYFKLAYTTIDTLINSGVYNVNEVNSALSSLKATSVQAQLAVQAGLSIYKAFAGDAVTAKLKSTEFLSVLQTLSDSIKQGVAFSTADSSIVASGGGVKSITVKVK